MATNQALFVSTSQSLLFRDPVRTISVSCPNDVPEALRETEAAVESGLHAAGFLTYEAAAAFGRELATHKPGSMPILWFALYDHSTALPPEEPIAENWNIGEWIPAVTEREYAEAIAGIHELIAAGDTYQVNYTLPLYSTFNGSALSWFRKLCRAQRSDYSAFIETDAFQVLSISPELFFSLDGERIQMKPMKGTRPRGLFPAADLRAARDLAESEKDRAENLMIVDLIRNDLGRISELGSVSVDSLFDVERYETVWQMTSTVSANTRATVPELFAALFPSGSVTGAPKIRTMQIIRELESVQRGIYCGAIGLWSPSRQAQFNVAIRTVTIERNTGKAEYHVGGGVTADSTSAGEFDECKTKAAILAYSHPDFELFESLLWNADYFLLEEHLARLQASAEYFGFVFVRHKIETALREFTNSFHAERSPRKVKLMLAPNGELRLEMSPVPAQRTLRVAFADAPVQSGEVFLYHKTTCRDVYNRAREAKPEYDDVLLWNERGEVTESTIANIVVEIDGEWLTPSVTCGLLGGTMRESLLKAGSIREAILTKTDVRNAKNVRLINAVRQWIDVTISE